MDLFADGEFRRFLGGVLAVLHHGLGNIASNSVPARVETVIATADRFTEYLKAGKIEEKT